MPEELAVSDASETTTTPELTDINKTTDAPETKSPAQGKWFSRLQGLDEDATGWVENMGWDNESAMVASHRELEKRLGAGPDNLLVIPDPENADAVTEFHRKLGMPEESSGYTYKPAEGAEVDKDLSESFDTAAHADSLSQPIF